MTLILHSRWNKQPTTYAAIDWNNPLARGLVDAVTPFDAVPPFSPYTGIKVNRYSNFGVAGNLYKLLTVTQSNRLVNEGTLFGLLNYNGITFGTFDSALIIYQSTNFPTDSDRVALATTSNATLEGCVIGKNSNVLNNDGRSIRTSGTFATLITYPTGTGSGALYENGVFQLSVPSAGAARPFATGKRRELLGKSAYMLAVWDRQLTSREIIEVSANPWQLFLKSTVAVPTYYPILSNLQATRGNTSIPLSTSIKY